MTAFGFVVRGWIAIAVIAGLVAWLDYLHSRWTYREHRRQLGKLPPRRVW